MTLFQLLRMMDANCPIKVTDLQNVVLDSAFKKDALKTDLLDYEVYKIGLNDIKHYANEPNCITIVLRK